VTFFRLPRHYRNERERRMRTAARRTLGQTHGFVKLEIQIAI